MLKNPLIQIVLIGLLAGLSTTRPSQAQTASNAGFAYPSNTPEIYFQLQAESAGRFTATLYVVNVGDVVPAGYEVASISLQGQQSEILNYTYTSPDNGWPTGIYRIVVSRDGEPIHESDFHVFAATGAAPPASTPTPQPSSQSGVIINGKTIDATMLARLEGSYGQVPPGRYWYDPMSGLYGLQGGPSLGQIAADLPLGGPLAANASGGGTSIFINGREIHPDELAYLTNIYGQIFPGRYWLNAQRIGGLEGQAASFDLGADERSMGISDGESVIMSSDGESSLSTGSDGCQYFSSGGISASTC